MNITIRKAVLQDAKELSNISHALTIQDYSAYPTGFLVFPKSPEQYKKCMEQSNHFFVAYDLDAETIAGWIIAEDMDELEAMYDYMHTQEAAIYDWLLQQPRNILYIDQIAVATQYQHKSIGSQLLKAVTESEPDKQYLAAISLKPAFNEQSVHFFSKKHGWGKIHELWDDIPGHPRILCGIYASKKPPSPTAQV